MLSIPAISRHVRLTFGALGLAGGITGCGDDPPIPCAGICIADPAPHCLRNDRPGDADCPGGLVHPRAAISGTACPGPAEEAACQWRPPPIEPFDALMLIDGFAVAPMEMHVTPPPDLAFAWTPPPRAAFVACAIFTCNPVFEQSAANDSATSQTATSRITNTGACMLALQTTTASPSSLPIEAPQQPVPAPVCVIERSYARVIDFVAAGCWAYDSTTLIAASRLVPLRPPDLATVLPEVPAQASCPRDQEPCYDDAHARPFFGTCLGGTCQPRCTSAQDCEVASQQLLGRAPDATCRWACQTVPTEPASLAGVCAALAL